MSLFRAFVLLVGVATLSACASFERGPDERGPDGTHSGPAAPVMAPAAAIAPVKVAAPIEPSSFTVHFEFAQDDIRASAMQILYGAAQVAKRGKPGLVRVQGFTDASGKRNFNLKLAQRRAEAVAGQLRKLGVAARIEIAAAEIIVAEAGRGKKDPANRKVEITFEDFPVTAENHPPVGDTVDTVMTDAPSPEAAIAAPQMSAAARSLHSIQPDISFQRSIAPPSSAIHVSTLN